MNKTCSTCHETKSTKHFHKNRSAADGYNNVCKDCRAGYHKQSYKPKGRTQKPYPTHIYCHKCNTTKPVGEFRSRSARRIPSSPCRDCENKHKREKSLTEKQLERKRERNNRFMKGYNQRSEVKKRRRSTGRIYSENRRARKANGDGVSDKEWKSILRKYGGQCLKCGTKDKVSMDHVKPLSKGGSHEPSNIQPLCLSCNSSKHTKETDYR